VSDTVELDRFSAFQRLAWSTLVLSVTRRCPLSCAHCITSSSRSPAHALLDVATAQRWAGEFPELVGEGLRFVTFTGGEPTLALDAVVVLAESARAAGVSTAIVSSGAFARTEAAAERVVGALGAVERWDLGYDEYHAEHLPLECFTNAIVAIRRRGRELTIRVCEGPDEARTDGLVAELQRLAGPGCEVHRQPVRRLGRATGLVIRSRGPQPPVLPCTSSGPLVRDDGAAAPCCAGLAYTEPNGHPFVLGDAGAHGSLADVWHAWRSDQLLRLLRLVGFSPVLAWLADAGIDTSALPTSHACELCPALWQTPGAMEVATARAAEPVVQARLVELERHLYGEVLGYAMPK
jgi:hypothetical protein